MPKLPPPIPKAKIKIVQKTVILKCLELGIDDPLDISQVIWRVYNMSNNKLTTGSIAALKAWKTRRDREKYDTPAFRIKGRKYGKQ